jgi:hypothetical protein
VGVGFVERDVRENNARVVALTDIILGFSDLYTNFARLAPNMTKSTDSELDEYYGPSIVEHLVGLKQQLGIAVKSELYRKGVQIADTEVKN